MSGPGRAAMIAGEMDELDRSREPELLGWTRMPPGLPRLAARVDSLEARLRATMTELRLLDDRASSLTREAEGTIELALQLLAEDWAGAGPTPESAA